MANGQGEKEGSVEEVADYETEDAKAEDADFVGIEDAKIAQGVKAHSNDEGALVHVGEGVCVKKQEVGSGEGGDDEGLCEKASLFVVFELCAVCQ